MGLKLQFYNTRTRKLEEFKPLHGNKVGLYTCGPTVYDFAHIGNLRTFIFEDVLRRVLEYTGHEINHVMNITDVGHLTSDADTGEDKLEVGAKREGITAWDVAKKYTKFFFEDIDKLNIIRAHHYPTATGHMQEQIDMIKKLEENGLTYKTSDGIYFDTSKFPDYGKMAMLKVEGLKPGARVDVKEKRNPTDFALWKFSPDGSKRDMEWDSPWGKGFPGWHIECSAMSMKYLGEQFDIHCGGIDHIQVHHTNEIAQAEGATGKSPCVNFWLHGEFLNMKDEKMSKSKGNFITMKTLEEKGYHPLDFRYLMLNAHYRKQTVFSWEAMDSARNSRKRLIEIMGELKRAEPEGSESDYIRQFDLAVADDLNIPQALAVMWNALRDKNLPSGEKLYLATRFDQIFGLNTLQDKEETVPKEIQELVEKREEYRKKKEWNKADEIREELVKKGWEVRDEEDGPILRPSIS